MSGRSCTACPTAARLEIVEEIRRWSDTASFGSGAAGRMRRRRSTALLRATVYSHVVNLAHPSHWWSSSHNPDQHVLDHVVHGVGVDHDPADRSSCQTLSVSMRRSIAPPSPLAAAEHVSIPAAKIVR